VPDVGMYITAKQPLATKIYDFQPNREAVNGSKISTSAKIETQQQAPEPTLLDNRQNSMENLLKLYIELGNNITGVP
jgi:hypothetical protein